jgi:hypothetical protein
MLFGKKQDDIKVGDWVTSYSQGIWRVERIIQDVYETRYSLTEPKKKSGEKFYILKRIVNKDWKRSISMESCNGVFVHKISKQDLNYLNSFIANNEKVMKDFEKYSKDMDLVLNISFSTDVDGIINFEEIANELFPNNEGYTSDEIIMKLNNSELAKYMDKTPITKTLQFVSHNMTVRGSEFIYLYNKALDF